MNSTFACLFVPDFAVQAVVRVEPELQGEAVAVLEGTPPVLKVAGVNERARQAGIDLGMTRLQAQGRLPFLVLRRRSQAQEAAAHAALLDCACAFSPRVEDNPEMPDGIVLDLSGLERLFGPLPKIACDLARRASELGLEANVAVAANPDAAVHAARGFCGVTVIPPGREAERLGPLPLEILGNSEILDTLARWGVRTFRALAALPETAVHERLGEIGVRWQLMARGEGTRPLVPSDPPLTFEEAVELEHPVALLEPLAFVLNRMLEQLCARLSARALSTSELRLILTLENPPGGHSNTERESSRDLRLMNTGEENLKFETVLRLPVPMLDARTFLKLLQLELRARPPAAAVEKIVLVAEPVKPRFTQGGLFLPTAPQPEKLEVTLARIRRVIRCQLPAARITSAPDAITDKSGDGQREKENAADNWPLTTDNCLGSPELLDTHRSDAFRMKPFAYKAAASRELRDVVVRSPSCSAQMCRMSLRRLRPPMQVRVELQQGRPVQILPASQLSTRGSQPATGNCLWVAGPWLESGEWWSGQAWSREVWDVIIEHKTTNAACRLYRDTSNNCWFVEAMYD